METDKDSAQTAALLLESVSATVKKMEDQYRVTGMAYNIFKITDIEEDEIPMCRVLADLLNPKGLHYQGSAYLALFIDMVVKPHIDKAEKLDLSKTKVIPEYTISEERRIDIVLYDRSVFIPIEVKIKAPEQPKQLADYASYSRKMNASGGFIPVLFLTPDGRESVEASKDDYVSISFYTHIIAWLEQCLKLEETKNALSVNEVIKQYIRSIKTFCRMEDKAMEINTLITESRSSCEAALLIYKAVNELDFDGKARATYTEKVAPLVKKAIPDAVFQPNDEGWDYLDIPIGNDCRIWINYDMKSIVVTNLNPKVKIPAETADAIAAIMAGITGGVRNESGKWQKGTIWATSKAQYPGFENTGDDNMYKYDLYQIYAKSPQSVADNIVSWVTELCEVKA